MIIDLRFDFSPEHDAGTVFVHSMRARAHLQSLLEQYPKYVESGLDLEWLLEYNAKISILQDYMSRHRRVEVAAEISLDGIGDFTISLHFSFGGGSSVCHLHVTYENLNPYGFEDIDET